jgi:hypothetical protein
MATKLTDRERKYRAEAIKAKAELKAMKDRAAEMSELREMFLNTLAAIRSMQAEQKAQAETLARYERHLDRMDDRSGKDRELIKEVNAHLWQTQNRMGAVRDFMVKHMERPSPWKRLVNLFKRKP